MKANELAKYIDHTLLKPDASAAQIKKICDEAKEYHFASVCVNPSRIRLVADELAGSGVTPCCVVGFPLGAIPSESKAAETAVAVKNGAGEIDMVINIGALKDGRLDDVREDIRAVVEASHPQAIVKAIIEESALTPEEIAIAARLVMEAGADFVKTSTGFGSGGATEEGVRIIRSVVGDRCKIKAATGINNRAICDAFLKLGVTRFGTSKGIRIVEDREA